MARTLTYAQFETFKSQLNAAFKAARKAGLLARQNFMCCGTCGSYALGEKITERAAAGKPTAGYVFYHAQDTDDLNYGYVYLKYSSAQSDDDDGTREVGKTLRAIFEEAGMLVEWDGDPMQTIKVRYQAVNHA
jgi:hypothetical protein